MKNWNVSPPMTDSTRTIVVGMMQTPPYDRMFEQSRRVYSAKGISPTLHTQGGAIKIQRYCWSYNHVRNTQIIHSTFVDRKGMG